MRHAKLTAALGALLAVSACAGAPGSGQAPATEGEAAAETPGADGGQLAAAGPGLFLGALMGSEIRRSLDEVDRLRASQAADRAKTVPLGETVTWHNPRTGHHGSVQPVRDGTSPSGNYCREFRQAVTAGDRTEENFGTACRQPDGSWRIER